MSTSLIVLLVIVGIIGLLLLISRRFRATIMDSIGEIIDTIVDLFD